MALLRVDLPTEEIGASDTSFQSGSPSLMMSTRSLQSNTANPRMSTRGTFSILNFDCFVSLGVSILDAGPHIWSMSASVNFGKDGSGTREASASDCLASGAGW